MEWNFARSHPPTLNKRPPPPGGGGGGKETTVCLSCPSSPFPSGASFISLASDLSKHCCYTIVHSSSHQRGKIQFGCNDRGESSKKTGLTTSGDLNPVPLNWEQYTSTPVGWARNRGNSPRGGKMEEGAKFINFLLPRLSANRGEETPPASPEGNFGRAALFGGGEKARKEDARMFP